MLPARARLRRRPEFTAVVRSGRRVGRPTMVLHYLAAPPSPAVPPRGAAGAPGSPVCARAGFVVGKAVGNSVVRHRVTRRLRAAVLDELPRLPPTAVLVVRARPEAAAASYRELTRDLALGLDRALAAGGDRR